MLFLSTIKTYYSLLNSSWVTDLEIFLCCLFGHKFSVFLFFLLNFVEFNLWDNSRTIFSFFHLPYFNIRWTTCLYFDTKLTSRHLYPGSCHISYMCFDNKQQLRCQDSETRWHRAGTKSRSCEIRGFNRK